MVRPGKCGRPLPLDFHLATKFEVAQNSIFWGFGAVSRRKKFWPKKWHLGRFRSKLIFASIGPNRHFFDKTFFLTKPPQTPKKSRFGPSADFVAKWKSCGRGRPHFPGLTKVSPQKPRRDLNCFSYPMHAWLHGMQPIAKRKCDGSLKNRFPTLRPSATPLPRPPGWSGWSPGWSG